MGRSTTVRAVVEHVAIPTEEETEYSTVSTDMEEWFDYHSDELAAMFHAVKDKAAEMGVYVLDGPNTVTFPAFVRMCFENSSGRKPPC